MSTCYRSTTTPHGILHADLWDPQGSLNKLFLSSSCLSLHDIASPKALQYGFQMDALSLCLS